MLSVFLLTFSAILAIYIYKHIIKPTKFWANQPLKYIPAWPIVGNYGNQAFKKKAFLELIQDMYNYYPNERYVGINVYLSPSLMIRDVDLIKTIAIKDFDHFTDHSGSELESVDPIMCKNLFFLTGERWKHMRDVLSPTFTSSKMKAMFGLMSVCAKHVLDHLKQQGSGQIEIEMQELLCRYTNDVIATCAYGNEVNSFKNRENEFYMTGKTATNLSGFKGLKFMFLMSCPKLLKFFRIPILTPKESNFFLSLTNQTIAHREKTKLIRPDMIHLLMQAQKDGLKSHKQVEEDRVISQASPQITESAAAKDSKITWKLSNVDISAQVFVFFLGGFDTVSVALSFFAYELAINIDIQRRLQKEIDDVLAKCEDCLPTYDMIVNMKYMDMVVCETFRKWTPAVQQDRICVKDYKISPVLPHEKPLVIKKGTLILFPVSGIHYDEKYFSNPQKFDPERFSEENKTNIKPYSYLPFGIGPRSCIGNRFAILEMKVLMFHLLSEFDLFRTTKSTIPIKLDAKNLMIRVLGGFNIGVKLRKANDL